jgi:hypothetical protein
MRKLKIKVIGPSSDVSSYDNEVARAIGRLLAQNNFKLIASQKALGVSSAAATGHMRAGRTPDRNIQQTPDVLIVVGNLSSAKTLNETTAFLTKAKPSQGESRPIILINGQSDEQVMLTKILAEVYEDKVIWVDSPEDAMKNLTSRYTAPVLQNNF